MALVFPKAAAAATTFCFQATPPPADSSSSSSSLGCCKCSYSNRFALSSSKFQEASFPETSTISTTTTMPWSERFNAFSTKAYSSILAIEESPSYKTEVISLHPKVMVEATMAREMLLRSEEACIGAAAAEAVALAKAAVNAAKDAAAAWEEIQSLPETDSLSNDDVPTHKIARIPQKEMLGIFRSFKESEPTDKDSGVQCNLNEATSFIFFSQLEKECSNFSKSKVKYIQTSQNIVKKTAKMRKKSRSKCRKEQILEKTAGICPKTVSGQTDKKTEKTVVLSVEFSNLLYLSQQLASSSSITACEEPILCQGIKDLAKLKKIKANIQMKIGKEPTPAQWAEAAGLDRRILQRRLLTGLYCKQRIIKGGLRLVIYIAKRYLGRGMSLPDLVQEGILGLIRGAEKYDYKKGFKFSTYVYWWIRHAITDAITKKSRTIRLPGFLLDTFSRITAAQESLYLNLGRHPTIEEIADSLGLSISRVRFVIKCTKFPRSIHQQITQNNGSSTLEDVIADPGVENAEIQVTKQLLARDIDMLLESLGPREKKVVRLRYGLHDGVSRTRDEVARLFQLSRERIRQIENAALGKLKQTDRSKDLRYYLYS